MELQNIEFKFAKQDLHQAQLEIQTLKDHLDHKDAALKQVNAKLVEMGAKPVTEEKMFDKHRAAWLKEMKATHQKRQESAKYQTQDILKAVFKKHHRQTHRGWSQVETKQPKTPTKPALNEVLAQRAESHGQRNDLDRSVSSKGSVPIVDAQLNPH